MIFSVSPGERGFHIEIGGGTWQADSCELRFPEEVWRPFPLKETLIRELAYAATLAIPVILGHSRVRYTTAPPSHLDFYQSCFEASIPNMVEPIPGESSDGVLQAFRSVEREFSLPRNTGEAFPRTRWNPRRAVLPFTFGKDSLLSLGTLISLGYEVIPVYVDERIHPRGNEIRGKLEEMFSRETGISVHVVENEIQLLSDYEVLGTPETRLYQVPAQLVHVLSMIPFCFAFEAQLIVLSNEHNDTLPTIHRDGYLCEHKVMKGKIVVDGLKRMVESLTCGMVTTVNPIGPLGNFSIYALLSHTFPHLQSYQISCHMELCHYNRWCHNCERCAHGYLYHSALGNDPEERKFESSMLTGEKKKHFSIFREFTHPLDGYHRFQAKEEKIAFLLSWERGARDDLVHLFERSSMRDALKKRTKLVKQVFRLQSEPGTEQVERDSANFFPAQLKEIRNIAGRNRSRIF